MKKKYLLIVTVFLILLNYSVNCLAWQELELGLEQTSLEQILTDSVIVATPSEVISKELENVRIGEKVLDSKLTDQTVQGTINQTNKLFQSVKINILRFDPKYFDFVLLCASEQNNISLNLQKWAQNNQLVAAINAAMFKEDRLTSIGYLRSGEHLNNSRIATRLGSFFLSEPKRNDLPNDLPVVQIIDYHKNMENIEDKINNYKYVVQNFRIIDNKKNILWTNNQALHAITALGKSEDYIYFIHSANPISVYTFADILLNQDIDGANLELEDLVYLEGGVQAAMFVDSPKLTKTWTSKHSTNILFNDFNPVLPNIIGVKAKLSK